MRSWTGPVVVGLVIGFGFAMANNSDDEDPSAVRSSPPAEVESAADRSGSVVSITFDDGPHGTYTPQVLDILDQHDAVAVFCVVGLKVEEHPALIRRIVDEGHALCNHTFTHDSRLSRRPAGRIEGEVAGTRAAIEDAAPGVPVPYFRQPTTFVSDDVGAVTDALGYRRLDWTIDTKDWTAPGAEAIVRTVVQQLRPGAVILLHDGGGDRSDTVAALPAILDAIANAGFRVGLPG